jgi:lactate dehydrogenase-like 2-hydroxyacid dehydrogenase
MKTYLIGSSKVFLEGAKTVLNVAGIKDTYIFVCENVTPQQLADNASDAEILVASPSASKHISKEHLAQMPKLKFITTFSVGTHWIDIEDAQELGITVSNQKGVNSEAVAEHCFAMILSLSKKMAQADRDMQNNAVRDRNFYTGFELYNRTIGIIGLGDIGKRVARIAGGFSMRVLGINKSGKAVQGVELVDLETLVKESDVIVVAVPHSDDTKEMLSFKEFDLMKDKVILVSISTEEVIDKDATIKALKSGKLFGYGIDIDITSSNENNDWLNYENVVITPHTASKTEESNKNYRDMTVENIKAFLDGKPIRVVN